MIVVREDKGQLFAADLGPARGSDNPGTLAQDWVPLGAGTNPILTVYPYGLNGDDGACDKTVYHLTFTYAGRVHVRELDPTVWPPTVYDRAVLNAYWDAFGVDTPGSVAADVHATTHVDIPIPNTMLSGPTYIWDVLTQVAKVTVERNQGIPCPALAVFAGWKLYKRFLPDGEWLVHKVLEPELPPTDFSLDMTTVPLPRVELALRFCYLWDPEAPNADPAVTGKYTMSPMGPSLLLDPVVHPCRFTAAPSDTLGVSSATSPGGAMCVEPASHAFVVPAYTVPGGAATALSCPGEQATVGAVAF